MKRLSPLLLLLVPSILSADPATLLRATDLKKEPATDAPAVASLAEGARVDTLERRGGWTHVRTEAGAQGWVKMLLLRLGGSGAVRQGDSGVAQLLNVARTGTSGTQVTTGVRGLDAEQIASARPNPGELKKLERYGTSRDGAAAFAAAGKLAAQRVEYRN
jgi:hypothetical protein